MRSRGGIAFGVHLLLLVVAAGLLPMGAVPAGGQASRPPYYVRKATARATLEASLAAAREHRPAMGPWYYAGPFDSARGAGFDTTYPPEQGVDLGAAYRGRGGQPVRWRRGDAFKDGQVNSLALFDDNNWLAVYLYRVIECASARDLPVLLGSDDTITLWLNGAKLLSRNVTRACGLQDERALLPLKAGRNDLLIKICQGEGPLGFAFTAADAGVPARAILDAIRADFPAAEVGALLQEEEWRGEYEVLGRQLANRGGINRFAATVRSPAALIADSDRDPADVVLRRTASLLEDLKRRSPRQPWGEMETRLRALKERSQHTGAGQAADREALYLDACRLRRRIAFANPLLSFSRILFVKHSKCGPTELVGNHMCDQYFGCNAVPGGGIYILEDPFGPAPTARNLLARSVVRKRRLTGRTLAPTGSFLSPTLSYDGRSVLFAYTELGQGERWSPGRSYHLFRVGVDGSGLEQLTDGPWNDFDPCWLPNGRICFISERRGGYGRCHGRPVPIYTLHSMAPDGSGIECVSHHESNEWGPSVNHEGRVVYTRWDYVDRGFSQAHHPWITTPDGRDARALHGNYPSEIGRRPWMEMHVRAVPGSRKYVATAAAHHGQAYGSLVLVDPGVEDDDAMAQVRRLTPDAPFPEAEGGGYGYATAWPLAEEYHLCAYDAGGETHGLYLVDSFGNKELLYRDPAVGCLTPIPLRATQRPPVLPQAAARAEARGAGATGTVTLLNVYDGLKPWPPGTRIRALRVIQVLPKSTPYANSPRIGHGSQKGARAVLGTVPVEADGSACFTLPAGKPVYFQALDERGLAVQSMRSDTYVHPRENLTCQGCHNPTRRSPSASGTAAALRRPPSAITPDVDGSNPFNYPRLVQPVLDRACVPCHSRTPYDPKAPDLGGNGGEHGWTRSYIHLRPYAFFFDGEAATTSRTVPGEFGARASRLFRMLDAGHHGVRLSPEDLHRITLWLDCNSDFYGAYENTEAQSRGEIVRPSLE